MFTDLVIELLSSDNLVVATVALKGTGLIDKVKKCPDIDLIEISRENRNHLQPGIPTEYFSP